MSERSSSDSAIAILVKTFEEIKCGARTLDPATEIKIVLLEHGLSLQPASPTAGEPELSPIDEARIESGFYASLECGALNIFEPAPASDAVAGDAKAFDICVMIVEEECYLDEPNYPANKHQRSVGYAIRDRIRAAQKEVALRSDAAGGEKLGSSEPLGPHYDGTTMDNQKLHAGPGGGMTTPHHSAGGVTSGAATPPNRDALASMFLTMWKNGNSPLQIADEIMSRFTSAAQQSTHGAPSDRQFSADLADDAAMTQSESRK